MNFINPITSLKPPLFRTPILGRLLRIFLLSPPTLASPSHSSRRRPRAVVRTVVDNDANLLRPPPCASCRPTPGLQQGGRYEEQPHERGRQGFRPVVAGSQIVRATVSGDPQEGRAAPVVRSIRPPDDDDADAGGGCVNGLGDGGSSVGTTTLLLRNIRWPLVHDPPGLSGADYRHSPVLSTCLDCRLWHRGVRIASTTRRARLSLMRRGGA